MANFFIIVVGLLFKDVKFAIHYFNDIMTSSFSINKEVRQGCPLTHTYFWMVSTSWLNKQYTMGRYKEYIRREKEQILSQYGDDMPFPRKVNEKNVDKILDIRNNFMFMSRLKFKIGNLFCHIGMILWTSNVIGLENTHGNGWGKEISWGYWELLLDSILI